MAFERDFYGLYSDMWVFLQTAVLCMFTARASGGADHSGREECAGSLTDMSHHLHRDSHSARLPATGQQNLTGLTGWLLPDRYSSCVCGS